MIGEFGSVEIEVAGRCRRWYQVGEPPDERLGRLPAENCSQWNDLEPLLVGKMGLEHCYESVILLPPRVPALDHGSRGQELLERQVTELEELDQPAVLHVVPGHHQQAATVLHPVDEVLDAPLDVAEFRRQGVAGLSQSRCQTRPTNLLHSVEHHRGGHKAKLRQRLVFGDRGVALRVPRHQQHLDRLAVQDCPPGGQSAYPPLDEEQGSQQQRVHRQPVDAVGLDDGFGQLLGVGPHLFRIAHHLAVPRPAQPANVVRI